MRLKKLSLLLALTLLVSVSALPVTAHAGGSKDTTPPTLTASLEGDALKIESSDDLSGVEAVFVDENRINSLTDGKASVALCEYMKEAGHTLFSAFTGSEALKIFRGEELDIIVLDIMLPEMSGIVVLHEIRKVSNIPVIMLTALDDEYTQSNSFDEMADDYITKPFSMLILGKRITALLRRSQSKPAVNMIKLGDVTVDFSGYTACDENGKIDITPKELEILKVLIDNKGLVLSRNQILDDVWGYDCDVIDRTIDAYIRNIRKKLRLDCITTVKGIGYKFEMGQEI